MPEDNITHISTRQQLAHHVKADNYHSRTEKSMRIIIKDVPAQPDQKIVIHLEDSIWIEYSKAVPHWCKMTNKWEEQMEARLLEVRLGGENKMRKTKLQEDAE